ncbi:MAG TPA: nickel-dependent lactate racemase [Feifaniaceae bacterium]|nr:nickel-dependent lactate racemase [Feifaniaceae bacterium]
MLIHLPYGNGHIPYDCGGARILTSRVGGMGGGRPGLEIVREAMERPIGAPPLSELGEGAARATVIISDHTRPVPSREILPPMLEAMRLYNPGIQITLLVATGFHRGTTRAELLQKLGPDILEREHVVVHDCEDAAQNVQIGILPSGAPLLIDRAAAETDLLVAEGFIEPHFFAGFSGGRKSVLPGVCDRVTVLGNHCSAFIDSPFARTGVLEGNPLHIDMLAAARLAKLRYIVNVVLDGGKNIVRAFAGDPAEAHNAGCEFLRQYCVVRAAPADVVITTNGGAPLDQNIYQCVKGLTAAEASANPGATLIVCAECADGAGGEAFYRSLRDCKSPAALYDEIMATPQKKTVQDQWESQILSRILKKHRVIFVSRPELESTVRDMKMEYAATLAQALLMAKAQKDGSNVTVIPDGVSVIVEPRQF